MVTRRQKQNVTPETSQLAAVANAMHIIKTYWTAYAVMLGTAMALKPDYAPPERGRRGKGAHPSDIHRASFAICGSSDPQYPGENTASGAKLPMQCVSAKHKYRKTAVVPQVTNTKLEFVAHQN